MLGRLVIWYRLVLIFDVLREFNRILFIKLFVMLEKNDDGVLR